MLNRNIFGFESDIKRFLLAASRCSKSAIKTTIEKLNSFSLNDVNNQYEGEREYRQSFLRTSQNKKKEEQLLIYKDTQENIRIFYYVAEKLVSGKNKTTTKEIVVNKEGKGTILINDEEKFFFNYDANKGVINRVISKEAQETINKIDLLDFDETAKIKLYKMAEEETLQTLREFTREQIEKASLGYYNEIVLQQSDMQETKTLQIKTKDGLQVSMENVNHVENNTRLEEIYLNGENNYKKIVFENGEKVSEETKPLEEDFVKFADGGGKE